MVGGVSHLRGIMLMHFSRRVWCPRQPRRHRGQMGYWFPGERSQRGWSNRELRLEICGVRYASQ